MEARRGIAHVAPPGETSVRGGLGVRDAASRARRRLADAHRLAAILLLKSMDGAMRVGDEELRVNVRDERVDRSVSIGDRSRRSVLAVGGSPAAGRRRRRGPPVGRGGCACKTLFPRTCEFDENFGRTVSWRRASGRRRFIRARDVEIRGRAFRRARRRRGPSSRSHENVREALSALDRRRGGEPRVRARKTFARAPRARPRAPPSPPSPPFGGRGSRS